MAFAFAASRWASSHTVWSSKTCRRLLAFAQRLPYGDHDPFSHGLFLQDVVAMVRRLHRAQAGEVLQQDHSGRQRLLDELIDRDLLRDGARPAVGVICRIGEDVAKHDVVRLREAACPPTPPWAC